MHLQLSLEFDAAPDSGIGFESLLPRPAVFALFPAPREGQPTLPYLSWTRNLRRRLTRLLSVKRAGSRLLNLREVTDQIEFQYVGSIFEGRWLLYLLNKHYFPRQYRERLRIKGPPLLKLNLENRFPRCYPTRRMTNDSSRYYGPFPTQVAAEHFAGEFLDLFKIRRCVEDLNPHPSHPGCIYSQLRMCLAPCFAGCTDSEYQSEVQRVVQFLDSQGQSLLRALQAERAEASEGLDFEYAAKIHRKLEKLNEVLRHGPDLLRNVRDLHAVVVLKGAEAKSVTFFRVVGGEIHGPATLSLDENVSSPVPLDQQLHELMESLSATGLEPASAPLPPWEHLSLLARWYYSSFREGELVMLNPAQEIPHARLIRQCRKLLTADHEPPG